MAALRLVAFSGMFVFGIVVALLGAVLPSLSLRLRLSMADAGALFAMMNFAMLTTSLLLGLAMDRFGMKLPLTFGPVLVGFALFLIGGATEAATVQIAAMCLGVGGGALNGGTNTLIADLHDDPREKASALNLLGVFYGFGALCLPFAVGALLSRLDLSGLLWTTAAGCLVVGVAAALPRFPAPKQSHALPIAAMPRMLRVPVVPAMALLLFFESGNEFVLGGYLSTLLTRDLAVSIETASYLLAAYWAAIMVGRLALSRLLLRFSADAVLLGSALVSAIGAMVIGTAPTAAVAVAGALLTGAALSGIFPTVLGIAGAQFRDHSGTVFGLLFTVALTGGMVIPWISGQLAEAAGVRGIFGLVAANFLAVAALSAIIRRVRRPV